MYCNCTNPKYKQVPAGFNTRNMIDYCTVCKKDKGPNAQSSSMVNSKDGTELLLVPGGEFLYDDNNEKLSIPEFQIAKYPVTIYQWKQFLSETKYEWNEWKDIKDQSSMNPITMVTIEDCEAYCAWAGLSLPTEQQWEKAARGTNGRKYPWGNEEPTKELCNCNELYGKILPVDALPLGNSPYGSAQMSGNVWEWTSSLWRQEREWCVFRGGSWDDGPYYVRAAYRFNSTPTDRYDRLGFRCARTK